MDRHAKSSADLALAMSRAAALEIEGKRVLLCRDLARVMGWRERQAGSVVAMARACGMQVRTAVKGRQLSRIVLDDAARDFLAHYYLFLPGEFEPYAAVGAEFRNPAYCRSLHLARLREAAMLAQAAFPLEEAAAKALDKLFTTCTACNDIAARLLLMQVAEALGAMAEGKVGQLLDRPSVCRPIPARPKAQLYDIKSRCGIRPEQRKTRGDAA